MRRLFWVFLSFSFVFSGRDYNEKLLQSELPQDEITESFKTLLLRQKATYSVIEDMVERKELTESQAKIATRYLDIGEKLLALVSALIEARRNEEDERFIYSTFISIKICQDAAVDIVSLISAYNKTHKKEDKETIQPYPENRFPNDWHFSKLEPS
jgi:hypothetical protein